VADAWKKRHADAVVVLMAITVVSRGVGGSYTRWQGKPPATLVVMHEWDDKWTTITVRHRGDQIVHLANGAIGPNDIPFAHDVDMADLPQEVMDGIMTDIKAVISDD